MLWHLCGRSICVSDVLSVICWHAILQVLVGVLSVDDFVPGVAEDHLVLLVLLQFDEIGSAAV